MTGDLHEADYEFRSRFTWDLITDGPTVHLVAPSYQPRLGRRAERVIAIAIPIIWHILMTYVLDNSRALNKTNSLTKYGHYILCCACFVISFQTMALIGQEYIFYSAFLWKIVACSTLNSILLQQFSIPLSMLLT